MATWSLYILGGVGILAVVLFALVYFYPSLFYTVLQSTPVTGPFDLSSVNKIYDSTQTTVFEQGGAATIQGLFYINPTQRTPTAINCGSDGNPSCDTGRFKTCTCTATDPTCATSCKRNGYAPVLQIGNTCFLEVLVAPDAGRQGKAMAQLSVRTKTTNQDANGNPTEVSSIEFLTLPPIPLQKWVMVTIVREGRRYHVYYNNSVVLSQKTLYNIGLSNNKPITCGNTYFNGAAAMFTLTAGSVTGVDIAAKYSQLTDTSGAPYIDVSLNGKKTDGAFKFPSICPPGGCFSAPTVRPAQPWLDWDTAYA